MVGIHIHHQLFTRARATPPLIRFYSFHLDKVENRIIRRAKHTIQRNKTPRPDQTIKLTRTLSFSSCNIRAFVIEMFFEQIVNFPACDCFGEVCHHCWAHDAVRGPPWSSSSSAFIK
ncbi:hypothetical protein XU18_3994 [Perkinsela sp. CCAP 1560/4]|nr:hypothetical protein XU18_3994 [Perkinsela sp. CCAP 1560/4]|eukprot:KNH04806.1 hypothetical protein XU18_3994 [Perkinsela sp. CCAP 1560/4]